jgi:hypothetical protein
MHAASYQFAWWYYVGVKKPSNISNQKELEDKYARPAFKWAPPLNMPHATEKNVL